MQPAVLVAPLPIPVPSSLSLMSDGDLFFFCGGDTKKESRVLLG